jgi:hypothetical protein
MKSLSPVLSTSRSAVPSTPSRWSIAMAIFGGVCNLLCLIFVFFQNYYLQHFQFVWSFSLIPLVAISLAPLLVLFALRHLSPVVFIYASTLFLILVWRVDYLVQYSRASAPFHKFDDPGILLLLLGMVSTAVVLVWAMSHFVGFIRRVLKSNGAAS